MSAIAGLWHLDGRPDAGRRIAPMMEALTPFGRDRADTWDGGFIALGARLTDLLPEDAFDRQPLVGGGGRFVLVADLRLDNRPELAAALSINAGRAAAMADADMLLSAWERWGTRTPGHLIGNFAFALWDREERRLHLVRDAMGERPLFYAAKDGIIAFATMYQGLHALPECPFAPDLAAVRAFAGFFSDYRDRSMHAGVRRVLAGTRLEIDSAGTATTHRYWDIFAVRPRSFSSDAECVEQYRAAWDRAVRDRLRSTGPIGCHLSSGYDSSAVATTAAAMLAERGQRLTAYTAVPMAGVPLQALPGQIIDEGPIAAITASRHANIDHILVGQDGRAIGEDQEEIFRYWQQPVRNLCNRVWRTDIARRMQQRGERVLLNGAFGNLTVSYHGREVLPELFRRGRWLQLARELNAMSGREGRLRRFLMNTLFPFVPMEVQYAIRRAFGKQSTSRAVFSPLRPEALAAIRREESEGRAEHMVDFSGFGYSTRAARIQVGLNQADIGAHSKFMLGAYGTDERDASRDQRFVELILSLPGSMFLKNGEARWIYRRAFAGQVPAEAMTTMALKGYQSADWMYRLHKGRATINEIVRSGLAIPEIADQLDVPFMENCLVADLNFERAHLREVETPLRTRFLMGVSVLDFVSRAKGAREESVMT